MASVLSSSACQQRLSARHSPQKRAGSESRATEGPRFEPWMLELVFGTQVGMQMLLVTRIFQPKCQPPPPPPPPPPPTIAVTCLEPCPPASSKILPEARLHSRSAMC